MNENNLTNNSSSTNSCDMFELSEDGKTLVKYHGTQEHVIVPEGVEIIGYKAFDHAINTQTIDLPETLTTIGQLAFLNAGLTQFVAPLSLREIGEKAFLRCDKLTSIALNDGLLSIENEAFSYTGIGQLTIPDTVTSMGLNILSYTPLASNFMPGNLAIYNNPNLIVDKNRAIYHRITEEHNGEPAEWELLDATLAYTPVYEVLEGCTSIGDTAFHANNNLWRVKLASTVKHIGYRAFYNCKKLTHVDFPDSLESIDEAAFEYSCVGAVYLGPNVTDVADSAFAGTCIINRQEPPALRSITVHPDNPYFFMQTGVLCKRLPHNKLKAIFYCGPDTKIEFPENLTEMGPYVFMDAANARELHFWDNLEAYDSRAFLTQVPIPDVYVHEKTPWCGFDVIHLCFPTDWRYVRWFSAAFISEGKETFDIKHALLQSDSAMFERAERMERNWHFLRRMQEPLPYDNNTRLSICTQIINKIELVAQDFAKGHNWKAFEYLRDLEFITIENANTVVEAVSELDDVEATSFILDFVKKIQDTQTTQESIADKYAL